MCRNVFLFAVTMMMIADGHGAESSGGARHARSHNVVWDSPSNDHHGSMPLGNGDISLNAWFQPNGELVFLIGKTDSWGDNARLLKVGKARVALTPNPLVEGGVVSADARLGARADGNRDRFLGAELSRRPAKRRRQARAVVARQRFAGAGWRSAHLRSLSQSHTQIAPAPMATPRRNIKLDRHSANRSVCSGGDHGLIISGVSLLGELTAGCTV